MTTQQPADLFLFVVAQWHVQCCPVLHDDELFVIDGDDGCGIQAIADCGVYGKYKHESLRT